MSDRVLMRSRLSGVGSIAAPPHMVADLIRDGWERVDPDPAPPKPRRTRKTTK